MQTNPSQAEARELFRRLIEIDTSSARGTTEAAEAAAGWLRDAGFADADCLFKDHGFAVLVARRSG